MSVAETSMAAYSDIKTKLGEKQQIVYDTIKEIEPASNEMIADYLNWPINRVTGRTNELAHYQAIVPHGLTVGKSGKLAKTWVVADLNDQRLKTVAVEPKRAVSWLHDDE